jgi:hypothetical protein
MQLVNMDCGNARCYVQLHCTSTVCVMAYKEPCKLHTATEFNHHDTHYVQPCCVPTHYAYMLTQENSSMRNTDRLCLCSVVEMEYCCAP